jgi:hypothetical protein
METRPAFVLVRFASSFVVAGGLAARATLQDPIIILADDAGWRTSESRGTASGETSPA